MGGGDLPERWASADDQARRLASALERAAPLLPVSAGAFADGRANDATEAVEAIGSRFARLQDHLGGKVFPLLVEIEDGTVGATMLDVLRAMERRGIVPGTRDWLALRAERNRLAHDYAPSPGEQAESANRCAAAGVAVLEAAERLRAYLTTYPELGVADPGPPMDLAPLRALAGRLR